jgi:hypothetical protein
MPDLPIIATQFYVALTGFVWGLGGLILSYGLFRTHTWALRMLCWGTPVFVVWYWIDRLVFMRSEYSRISRPASIVFTIIALGVIYWIQQRSDVRAAFKENNK